MSRNNALRKPRTIKAKDVVTVTAIGGLGYLLLTHGSQGPTGGGGGASKKERVTGVIADELGGLGVSTPGYTINLPGAGGGTFVFPDFPTAPDSSEFIGPDYTDPGHKYKVPFEWPKLPKIGDIDILNELIGVDSKKAQKVAELGIKTTAKIIPFTNPITAAVQVFKFVLKPEIPDKVQGTGQILTKKGRGGRVKAFREKYKVPKDYNYPITHKAVKVL